MSKLDVMGDASYEARQQRIMRLKNAFNNQELITVASVVKKWGYRESTVIGWAKAGNIPLIGSNNQPVVPMTDENKPKWL